MDPIATGGSDYRTGQATNVGMYARRQKNFLKDPQPSFPHLLVLSRQKTRLPWCPSGKESTSNAGDTGSVPGSGRSPGEGNGNPLQCFCLGNPRDRGASGLQSMRSQRVRHD